MPKIFSDYEKKQWADEYRMGTCVREICRQYHVSKNTVYKYIKLFDARSSKRNMEISGHRLLTLEQQNEHLKEIIAVSKECPCGAVAPRTEKLKAAEQLEGRYSMRVICEYLDLPRGTYYNYKRAKTKIKVDTVRDETFRPLIKSVFQKSGERFSAAAIRHKLKSQGFEIGVKRIKRLMEEMNLVPISRRNVTFYSFLLRKKKQAEKTIYPDRTKQGLGK